MISNLKTMHDSKENIPIRTVFHSNPLKNQHRVTIFQRKVVDRAQLLRAFGSKRKGRLWKVRCVGCKTWIVKIIRNKFSTHSRHSHTRLQPETRFCSGLRSPTQVFSRHFQSFNFFRNASCSKESALSPSINKRQTTPHQDEAGQRATKCQIKHIIRSLSQFFCIVSHSTPLDLEPDPTKQKTSTQTPLRIFQVLGLFISVLETT